MGERELEEWESEKKIRKKIDRDRGESGRYKKKRNVQRKRAKDT